MHDERLIGVGGLGVEGEAAVVVAVEGRGEVGGGTGLLVEAAVQQRLVEAVPHVQRVAPHVFVERPDGAKVRLLVPEVEGLQELQPAANVGATGVRVVQQLAQLPPRDGLDVAHRHGRELHRVAVLDLRHLHHL